MNLEKQAKETIIITYNKNVDEFEVTSINLNTPIVDDLSTIHTSNNGLIGRGKTPLSALKQFVKDCKKINKL